MARLVCGIGVNDRKYPAKVNGKILKEYHLWSDLLIRCYSPKYQGKFPTYVGCQVSENFKNYSYFYEWCQSQIGFGQKGYHLDKDLLVKENKIYSEETCLFLPQELNNLLVSCRACRGSYPVGVSAYQGKFEAQCSHNASSKHLGRFDTIEEAFQAYKETKETYIRLQAEKWKALIDPRAFAALMAYTVQITD